MITFFEGWLVALGSLLMGTLGGLIGIAIGLELPITEKEVANATYLCVCLGVIIGFSTWLYWISVTGT